jgi:tetratricopeptide (TPR) repeat protein
MSAQIEKAQLLIGQQRFELAIKELRQELQSNPDEPHVHALLAVCLRQLDRNEEALESARRAVQAGPDYAYGHYVLAGVYDQDDRLKEAEQAIREAIRLDPEDADYHTRLSSIQLQQRRWEEGLRAAERALELDPTNARGLNLRAMALSNLDRSDEAAAAYQSALAANPEDAMAHASKGWQEVRAGNLDSAMASFREALRLDSSLAWAREGVVEALKARNPIYRVMLSYFLWTARLEPKVLWGLIIGGFILARVLRDFGKSNPEWAPYIWPALGLYAAFCLMTWIADPLFNLLLRLHPLGRIALSEQQRVAANWFGGSLLLALLSLAAALVLDSEWLLMLAMASGFMVIPISSSLGTESGRARKILLTYTWVLGACGALFVGASMFSDSGPVVAIPFGIFLIGVVTFFWVANWIRIRY